MLAACLSFFGALISLTRWMGRERISNRVYRIPGVPMTFDYRGYVTGTDWDRGGAVLQSRFTGRRANAIPRVGQVWKSSDPRRLSAFRIMHVDQPWLVDEGVVSERHVDIEMITNPGITGRTARTLTLARFQVLGPKGYTRVS